MCTEEMISPSSSGLHTTTWSYNNSTVYARLCGILCKSTFLKCFCFFCPRTVIYINTCSLLNCETRMSQFLDFPVKPRQRLMLAPIFSYVCIYSKIGHLGKTDKPVCSFNNYCLSVLSLPCRFGFMKH